jgi:hypothetical protein
MSMSSICLGGASKMSMSLSFLGLIRASSSIFHSDDKILTFVKAF